MIGLAMIDDASDLSSLSEIEPIQVFDGVVARRVEGDLVTLAIVELDPGAIVPEHVHAAEQNGMVIRGQMTFRVGERERVLGPGGTWRIRGGIPHRAQAGPDGAVVIDVFSPIRDDWEDRPPVARPPRWPRPEDEA
jgi:quercetin dioxygenase-like cupin family protein